MLRRSSAGPRRSLSFHTPIFQRTESARIPFFQQSPSPSFMGRTARPLLSTFSSRPQLLTKQNTMSMTSADASASDLDLNQLVSHFKKNVSIKDRRYRFTTYKDVFVGADAVQWMVTSGIAETRQDAVKIGLMMQEAGLIEHCVRDHEYVPLFLHKLFWF